MESILLCDGPVFQLADAFAKTCRLLSPGRPLCPRGAGVIVGGRDQFIDVLLLLHDQILLTGDLSLGSGERDLCRAKLGRKELVGVGVLLIEVINCDALVVELLKNDIRTVNRQACADHEKCDEGIDHIGQNVAD